MFDPYFPVRREEPVPGEWQTDENGKRYRMVGGVKEFAPTIHTANFGTVYVDDLPKLNQRYQEQEEQRRKQESEARADAETGRVCPFKEGRNQLHTKCEKSCAFYADTACVFASMDIQPTRDTNGADCTISRKRCGEVCAMYNHGCTLIEFVMGMKLGKE